MKKTTENAKDLISTKRRYFHFLSHSLYYGAKIFLTILSLIFIDVRLKYGKDIIQLVIFNS